MGNAISTIRVEILNRVVVTKSTTPQPNSADSMGGADIASDLLTIADARVSTGFSRKPAP